MLKTASKWLSMPAFNLASMMAAKLWFQVHSLLVPVDKIVFVKIYKYLSFLLSRMPELLFSVGRSLRTSASISPVRELPMKALVRLAVPSPMKL